MAEEWNIPAFAAKLLVGKTIAAIEETYPHYVSITFTDGASLGLTAMPFKDGTIDVSFVPAVDDSW